MAAGSKAQEAGVLKQSPGFLTGPDPSLPTCNCMITAPGMPEIVV
ncbi:hypothetical protein B4098_2988 [Heyndrickxia coagulans]|uniref:Uncharacterized protein n=1 Tax=Heyndrickxia coagulans TaxID=1398 RepID=A0A150JVG1_HEYCO|nr:hypothetical protein B4098_2988 [Heyndrickxia coagulans]